MGSQLTEYLASCEGKPFEWGGNNCVSFVRGFVPSIPADWAEGYDDAVSARHAYRRMLSEYGHDNIIDALDARFERVLTLHPEDGMICARRENGPLRYALGLTFGQCCVFLSEDGPVRSDVDVSDMFWRVA